MYKFALAATTLFISTMASAYDPFLTGYKQAEPGPYLPMRQIQDFVKKDRENTRFIFAKVDNYRNEVKIARHAYQEPNLIPSNLNYQFKYVEYQIKQQYGKNSELTRLQILMNCDNQTEMVVSTSYLPAGIYHNRTVSEGKFNSKSAAERLEVCNILKSRSKNLGIQAPQEMVMLNDFRIYLNELNDSTPDYLFSIKDNNPNFALDQHFFKDKMQRKKLKKYPDSFKVFNFGYKGSFNKVLTISNIQVDCKSPAEFIHSYREYAVKDAVYKGGEAHQVLASISKNSNGNDPRSNIDKLCKHK